VSKAKPKFWRGTGGAWMTDTFDPLLCQRTEENEVTTFYGPGYFIGESMKTGAMKELTAKLGGVWLEEPIAWSVWYDIEPRLNPDKRKKGQ